MNTRSQVFEETYRNYLGQIAGINFKPSEKGLGIKVEKDEITIPFFRKPYRVTEKSIISPSGKQPSFEKCLTYLIFPYGIFYDNHHKQ